MGLEVREKTIVALDSQIASMKVYTHEGNDHKTFNIELCGFRDYCTSHMISGLTKLDLIDLRECLNEVIKFLEKK